MCMFKSFSKSLFFLSLSLSRFLLCSCQSVWEYGAGWDDCVTSPCLGHTQSALPARVRTASWCPPGGQSTRTHVASGFLPKFFLRSCYLNMHLVFMSQMCLSGQKVDVQIAVELSFTLSLLSKQPRNPLCPAAGTRVTLLPSSHWQFICEERWFPQGTAGLQRPLYLLCSPRAKPLVSAHSTMVHIEIPRTLFQPLQRNKRTGSHFPDSSSTCLPAPGALPASSPRNQWDTASAEPRKIYSQTTAIV